MLRHGALGYPMLGVPHIIVGQDEVILQLLSIEWLLEQGIVLGS